MSLSYLRTCYACRRGSKALPFVLFVVCFVSYLALSGWSKGQDVSDSKNSQRQAASTSTNQIVVTLNRVLSSVTLSYLATIAQVRVYETQPNDTLASVSAKELADVRGAVELLASLNPDVVDTGRDDEVQANAPLPPNTKLLVPDLSPVISKVELKHKASLPEIAREYYGEGRKGIKLILEANPSIKLPDELPPQTLLFLPDVDTPTEFALRNGIDSHEAVTELRKQGHHKTDQDYEGRLIPNVALTDGALSAMGVKYQLKDVDEKWFIAKLGANHLTDRDLELPARAAPVTIALLDSGLDFKHPDFSGNVWENKRPNDDRFHKVTDDFHGFDFVNRLSLPQDSLKDSHGTHLAGIASARVLATWVPALKHSATDEHLKLMILRVADDREKVHLGAILEAIRYAVRHNARVVSCSWDLDGSDALSGEFEEDENVLFVVSAGNGREHSVNGERVQVGFLIDDANHVYPASFEGKSMITVGASGPDDKRALFSNYGAKSVQLLAPGVKIKSTVISGNNENYGFGSGTSQAASFVALAAGLIFAKHAEMDAISVKNRILYTADADPETLKIVSHGRLNLLKAVSMDEDLIELRSSKEPPVRGDITTSTLHFAEGDLGCQDARKFAVKDDHLFRVIVDFDSQKSLLFLGTDRRRGSICDRSVTIHTEAGDRTLQMTTVHDIVWRGVPQNPEP